MPSELQLLDPTEAQIKQVAAALASIDPWRRLGISQQGLLRSLSEAGPDIVCQSLVADSDLLGISVVRKNWLFGDYLKLFAVLPGMQGHGHGHAAIEKLCTACTATGGTNLWACVSAFNSQAQTFYERCGFETIGRISDLVVSGEDELLIRRRLA